jgi:hypothetical protein
MAMIAGNNAVTSGMPAPSGGRSEIDPSDIEVLLPWHAIGRLAPRDAQLVEEALHRDPALSRQFTVIRDEIAETIHLNESLGAPSARAMQRLLEGIDAEPARLAPGLSLWSRFQLFLTTLSPRAVALSATAAAALVLVQAGVIGTLLAHPPVSYETASYTAASESGIPVMLRFSDSASIADISAFLERYDGVIVSGPKAGLFRVQFGTSKPSKDDAARLLTRLQDEKVVTFVVPAE